MVTKGPAEMAGSISSFFNNMGRIDAVKHVTLMEIKMDMPTTIPNIKWAMVFLHFRQFPENSVLPSMYHPQTW